MAISEENVGAFKRALDAFNRRDFDAVLEQLDAEGSASGVQTLLDGETTTFRDGRRFGRSFRAWSTAALMVGRGTLRKMRQNLGWAIGYNSIALPIAAGSSSHRSDWS